MRRITQLALSLLALALSTAPVLAQTGSIEGRVSRADGSGIGGVTVVIEQTGAEALTGADGRYRFAGLAAGSYDLTLTHRDDRQREADVQVNGGEATELETTVDWEVSLAETITVYSASRRPERIVDAPQAVTRVTEEEIERGAGTGQVPKLLEFTPGAEVTQSGLYDYNLNTRGFNSSLNRRVATLVDGRDPSVPFLGAQEWAAISFPMDDLASAELVRGPSAALYGANASSGVLNLVTKQPRYSQGGVVRLTAGELSTLNADVRWAGRVGEDSYFKLVGGLRDSGDFTVSRRGAAEYTQPCNASAGITQECLPQEAVPLALEDDDQIVFGSARFDHYFRDTSFLTLEGGQANVEGPVFQTGIGRVQLVDVERPWARVNYTATAWNALLTYNKRDAPEQLALASGANLVLDTDNVQLEAQGHWTLGDGDGRLVVGGLYQQEDIDSRDPKTGRQTLIFEPVDSDSQAVYGQLDWDLAPRWKLVLAGRWDDSSLHDSQFSPKGALVFGLNDSSSLRLTYTEAFQVANYSEFFLQAPAAPPVDLTLLNQLVCGQFGVDCGLGVTPVLAVGNEDLELEQVKTIEIGYSGIIRDKAFLTLDYYNSKNENFITDLLPQLGTPLGRINPSYGPWQAPASIPEPLASAIEAAILSQVPLLSNNLDGRPIIVGASYTNFGQVDTQGIDFGLNYYTDNGFEASFSYSWFDFDIKESAPGLEDLLLPNSPENKVAFGLVYTAPRWSLGANARWVDDFLWYVGPFQGTVESYTTVDVTGSYEINDSWDVSLNVANAFDDAHWESFGGDLLGRRALASVSFGW
ncbi:MAG: TonB-dependent receptor [Thermoanaerobaculia bacterium]